MRNTADIRKFILGGKATFTITSVGTGTRFTYRVDVVEGKVRTSTFVKLLNGPDNTQDFAYMGMLIDGTVVPTKASKVTVNAASWKAIAWFLDALMKCDELPEVVKFNHEGKCGRCGRALTVPESIESGFGPECIKHI